MKWLISIAIGGFALLSFAQDGAEYQLLWEIKGKQLKKPSYLFGSMHSNDPRLFQFPDSLYVAFAKADAVVLETDVSALFDEYDVRLDMFNLEILSKNKPYTNSREATSTVYGSEDGRPQFLDAWFQQTGYCAGKSFFALEQLDDQLAALEKLHQLTDRPSALTSLLFSKEAFIQSYIHGDIASLSKMLKSQLDGAPGAYEALITKRNIVMANGLDTLMRKRSVFCAVGSGHLHGPEGIIQLLRSKGYSVRCVRATYSGDPIPAKTTVGSWRSYTVASDTFDFEITLSGKPLEFSSADNYRFIYQELGQGNTFELIVRATDEQLSDYEATFIDNQRVRPVKLTLENGLQAVEGMYHDEWKGLQWRRVIIDGDRTYVLVCYGGNKFMHSDRPKKYFDRLKINR
jgi:uncharacterized protein YbaP (TraB family)